MPFWQFFRKGWDGRALLVQPSKSNHGIWKILFVLCFYEYLERLEGKIINCIFLWVDTSDNYNVKCFKNCEKAGAKKKLEYVSTLLENILPLWYITYLWSNIHGPCILFLGILQFRWHRNKERLACPSLSVYKTRPCSFVKIISQCYPNLICIKIGRKYLFQLYLNFIEIFRHFIETGDRLGSSWFSISRDMPENTVSLGHTYLYPRSPF